MVKALELKGEKAGLFMQAADAEMFAAQQRKGSPLNQPERQRVLDRMALKGQTDPGLVDLACSRPAPKAGLEA